MSKNPYIPFYPSDWLAGTRGLSAAETGVYITLISMMYEREVPLDFDHKRLARLCGTTSQTFKASLSVLIEEGKIIETDAGLWNERVDAELEKRSEKSHRNSESAKVRWKKDKQKQRQTDTNAMPTQCERNANQNQNHIPPIVPQADDPSPPKRKRRSSLPPNFPDEKAIEWAVKDKHLSRDQALAEAQGFRDFWLGDGGLKADWMATWRGRINRALDAGRLKPGGDGEMSQTARDAIERKRRRQADQQEGSAQPEHLFLAAGGMR